MLGWFLLLVLRVLLGVGVERLELALLPLAAALNLGTLEQKMAEILGIIVNWSLSCVGPIMDDLSEGLVNLL